MGSILATFSFGSTTNRVIISGLREKYQDKISDWAGAIQAARRSLAKILPEHRDKILYRLQDGYTYIVRDEHTLEQMAGRPPSEGKAWGGKPEVRKRMFANFAREEGNGRVHPYARLSPWFQELHDPSTGPLFHMQRSGFSGRTDGGASLFDNLRAIDMPENLFWAIEFGNKENLIYWRYLQYGTSKMVPRGNFRLRLYRDYVEDFNKDVKRRLDSLFRGRAKAGK